MQLIEKQFENQKVLYAWFLSMHTRVDVLLVSDFARDDLSLVATQIQSEIDRFEKIANRFDHSSELSQLNTSAFKRPVTLSDELFGLIRDAMIFNKTTLGLFDITVNSLNGFCCGCNLVELDTTSQTVKLNHPDLKLDLSGFVKGYVLRSIRKLISEANISSALINMGNSSVLAIGNHPHGAGWNVETVTNSFTLNDQCLTTSGNTNGTIWPIIHPLKNEVKTTNQQLSVVTYDPALGEVLSKALYLATDVEKSTILENIQVEIEWEMSLLREEYNSFYRTTMK